MVYLRPIGGLCNRLRTIDSALELSKKSDSEITVLWVMNNFLNAKFEDLFEPLGSNRVKVVNCPIGFPELFLSHYGRGAEGYKYLLSEPFAFRMIKNWLKGRFLTAEQKFILREVKRTKSEDVFLNEELTSIYNSDQNGFEYSARELDKLFIPKVADRLPHFFSGTKKSTYISSCYRMYPLQGSYEDFVPSAHIRNKIENTANRFNDYTYGLHIRGTDHVVSKSHSASDKFLELVNKIINQEKDATFFLSTDDQEAKEMLLAEFGPKIYYNDISDYDRNSPSAMADAVVDLYCLSRTKMIYGSHQSSFSQTAADMGNIKEVTVK